MTSEERLGQGGGARGLPNRVCFLVNLRDALCCRRCGKRPEAAEGYHRGFEYHHLRPRREAGPDTVENLVLLCRDCHLGLHKRSHSPSSDWNEQSHLPNEQSHFDPAAPEGFACRGCGACLDAGTVEMNCGWYRCGECGRRVHLFEHFYG